MLAHCQLLWTCTLGPPSAVRDSFHAAIAELLPNKTVTGRLLPRPATRLMTRKAGGDDAATANRTFLRVECAVVGTDQAIIIGITQRNAHRTIMLCALVLCGMVFVVPPVLPFLLDANFASTGPAVQLLGWMALLAAPDNAAAS